MLAASIATTFLTVAGIGIAAESGTMLSQSSSEASTEEGMMNMKDEMRNCPVMGGRMDALSPQQQMQMHAEMMQAMGQIMQKYAGQAHPATE